MNSSGALLVERMQAGTPSRSKSSMLRAGGRGGGGVEHPPEEGAASGVWAGRAHRHLPGEARRWRCSKRMRGRGGPVCAHQQARAPSPRRNMETQMGNHAAAACLLMVTTGVLRWNRKTARLAAAVRGRAAGRSGACRGGEQALGTALQGAAGASAPSCSPLTPETAAQQRAHCRQRPTRFRSARCRSTSLCPRRWWGWGPRRRCWKA